MFALYGMDWRNKSSIKIFDLAALGESQGHIAWFILLEASGDYIRENVI